MNPILEPEEPAPPLPQRKRSVRFEGVVDGQLDVDSQQNDARQRRRTSTRSSISQRLSQQVDKLIGTPGKETVIHRTKKPKQPVMPLLTTYGEDFAIENGNLSPSTISSNSANNLTWSPVSTASTAATSWASPRSSGPITRNRLSPDDCQMQSKSVYAGTEDSQLPPIQENSGRIIMFPVQEAPVEARPSIATVENVAAAKIYFETKYDQLLQVPCSPRSLRRKKLETRMADLCMNHDERASARQQWHRAESDHLRQTRVLNATSGARHQTRDVKIAGFDVIRVLGKGSFGVVRLVTERVKSTASAAPNGHSHPQHSTGATAVSNVDGTAKHNIPAGKPLSDVFAMKVIRKSDMLRACQEGHLRAERDFLVGAEGSRWVVPLIASFQDATNLYLVMEYMIGGDLIGLLLREDVLDEDVAK